MQQRQLPPGIDPKAVAADPEGWQRHLQAAQEQEARMPGSTFLSQQASAPVEQFGATVVPRDMNAEYLSSLAEEMRRREMEETRNALAGQEPLGMRGGGIADLLRYYRR